MKIKIVCVGKIKEKHILAGINEYIKRLTPFCKLEVFEVGDERIPDKITEGEKEKLLKCEGDKILKYLSEKDYIISLCIEGKTMSSTGFAQNLSEIMLQGKSSVAFVIGGSLGLLEDIKKQSHLRLSFSPMTFPHQLMRLILAEQIYRAFKIINGGDYHK